jgi:hypothetical protein
LIDTIDDMAPLLVYSQGLESQSVLVVVEELEVPLQATATPLESNGFGS